MRAASLFRDYIHATAHLEDAASPELRDRAGGMLRHRIRRTAENRGVGIDAIASDIADVALARAENRPPPIYVVGLGGSGSHWLTGMLAEMLPVANIEEAPIPTDLETQIESLPAAEQGVMIDCLHLSYAAALCSAPKLMDLVQVQILHSAVRVIEPRHKTWDPGCFVIYLLRDPRDQAVCFALRKQEFRRRHYPNASDSQYLAGCALNNARNYAEMHQSSIRPDFVCRYEELQKATPAVLQRMAAAIGQSVDMEAATRAARKHDASLMRSGVLASKGNLYPTPGRGWQKETNEHQKLLLHSLLAEVVTDADYPTDDCLGRPLPMAVSSAEKRLLFKADGGVGTLFTRGVSEYREGTWTRYGDASGEVRVLPGVALKLRVHEHAIPAAIRTLNGLPKDALDSLCLAGNVSLNDKLLGECMASMGTLQELDLARTGVTNNCVDSVASLPVLAGVNICGTDLSPTAIAALKDALGPSTVVGSE